MLKRTLAMWSCTVVLATVVGGQGADDVTARRVPFHVPAVGLPLTPYSVQRAMAELAWTVRTPIGYEALSDESWQPSRPDSTIQTEGLTLEEVLDSIVERQPRYQWSTQNRVVHLRPRAALTDPDNILNRHIEAFIVNDTTLPLVLREIHFTLRPEMREGGIVGSGPAPTALGLRRFSVSVRRSTVEGVLDGIVTAHGASSWSVTYVAEPGATRRYRISFQTFDGWGTTW